MKPTVVPAVAANLLWLSEVDSTNQVAARLVAAWSDDEDDRLEDTVVVAAAQTAGRGRSDHAWESPAGGLYATWLGWVPTEALAWLPLAAGVSVAAAVEDAMPGLTVSLKWPNDVIVAGEKLGGVLCLSRVRGDQAWAVVGVGVNVEVAPTLPTANSIAPTCLRAQGLAGSGDAAIWAIIGSFTRRLRDTLARPGELRSLWLARCVHRAGEPLRIRSGGDVVVGGFVGLGEHGQLELEVDGARREFTAAELIAPLPEAGG